MKNWPCETAIEASKAVTVVPMFAPTLPEADHVRSQHVECPGRRLRPPLGIAVLKCVGEGEAVQGMEVPSGMAAPQV